MLRPWSPIPIHEDSDPLEPLPPEFLRIEPHPYAALGAPYGPGGDPFRLRRGVIERLLQAQTLLQERQPGWRLAIFDAWRPLAVQRFMVEHTLRVECLARGIDPSSESAARDQVVAEVGRFWAPPCDDPAMPPPHSTGAAVDLTLATGDGCLLDMGGAIDAIGPVSEPDHHAAAAAADPEGLAACWHGRRRSLQEAMASTGFAQHPNEWWHFSHGDQLWAWRSGESVARYGRVGGISSSSPAS
jgi:D-alanyl-D-alanine dipeptidase